MTWYLVQNRNSQFKSKKERDAFLIKQLESIRDQIRNKGAVADACEADGNKLEAAAKKAAAIADSQAVEASEASKKIDELDKALKKAKDMRAASSQQLQDKFR
jgi:hypothetical protein